MKENIRINRGNEPYIFEELVEIIRTLRSEDGCPWDREQSHESLKNCLIEECYEVIDAIDKKDKENLCEELGDVMLQTVMHAVMAEEEKSFTMSQVVDGIAAKMIHRHPHVFGDGHAHNAEAVLENWEEIKKEEKKETSVGESMRRVPKALPANIRAAKIQKKAAAVGFDFAGYKQALEKVYEEIEELNTALNMGEKNQIEEEYGDLMFSVVNLSRFLKLNAENSLTNATDKFINRFVDVELLVLEEDKRLCHMSIDKLNKLWEQVK